MTETRRRANKQAASNATELVTDPRYAVEPALGHALFRVMRSLVFYDKPVPELDSLPLAQLRLLMVVYHGADGTMKDFSEKMDVSQSTVTQLAERLVARGLVERHADLHDRRVVRLRVSPLGKQVITISDHIRRQTLCEVWELLTSEEQKTVMAGLDILAQVAEKVRAAQGRPLKPWPSEPVCSEESDSERAEGMQPQPVVDLMARRVRGRNAPV